jgi:pSer/pThr/pTyr-binding forkhead associated (FHA) protein
MSAPTVRHVLVIDDSDGRRAVGLNAATYSIGRDPSNAIVLKGDGISRQHAILLRVPQGGGYRYRILDGNSAGKPSTNGVHVNGVRCASHDLEHKDALAFSDGITAHYYAMPMTDEEYTRYTESPDFRSIKSEVTDEQNTQLL